MEITVREVTKETKSTQELEKELLQKHEEKFENEESSGRGRRRKNSIVRVK